MNLFPRLNFFKPEEFECKCGCGYVVFNDSFLFKLDLAREFSNIPYQITSACRCRKHNKAIGGVVDSSHIFGWAVDIKCDNSADRIKLVYGLIMADFKRIIVYKGFVHVDADPRKKPMFKVK